MNNCFNETGACLTPTVGTAPQTFASALRFFAAAQCALTETPIPQSKVGDSECFDIIIAGGGTAGCIVANRLSEICDWKILLIEAGDDPPVESNIPGFYKSLFHSKYDWEFMSINNGRTSQALRNGSTYLPSGKMLGGGSAFNGMAYVKCNKNDYKRWYDQGNKEWHPKIVDKYFKKAENLQDMKLLENSTIYKNFGHYGPYIMTRFNSTYRDITEKVLASWNQLNIKRVPDVNTASFGCSIAIASAYNGMRVSTKSAYLNPIASTRSNLKILKNTLVTKILINAKTKKAYGVEVKCKGSKKKFYAKREVILCAGSIGSPHLLLLSGIGPKEHLESKNISCILDQPMVGQNLQDHSVVNVPIYAKKPGKIDEKKRHLDEINYLYNKTGYLAHVTLADIMGFYSNRKDATYADHQVLLSLFWQNSTNLENSLTSQFRYSKQIIDSLVKPNKDYALYLFLIISLHPLSTGSLRLKSKDPEERPLIDFNFFNEPKDLESLVSAIKRITKIVNTEYFKSNDGYLGRMKWDACDHFKLDSVDYWKCICINTVATLYHVIATCKMGPNSNVSVVDSRLKVHGLKNLRIIDASIMPLTTSGNTCAPTIMVAERASDLVKEDHNRRP